MGTCTFHFRQPRAMEFSPDSWFCHRGQRYPIFPLEATLTPPAQLSPSSVGPSFTSPLSSLPVSSNKGWPRSSLSSSFTCPTDDLFSLQPWSPDLHTPTSLPAPTFPHQPCCCLTFSTHSLTHSRKTIILVNTRHENCFLNKWLRSKMLVVILHHSDQMSSMV